jgi:hypothetical protein
LTYSFSDHKLRSPSSPEQVGSSEHLTQFRGKRIDLALAISETDVIPVAF